MKEIENFSKCAEIDQVAYKKTIDNSNFNMLTQKIVTDNYKTLIRQLYWLNLSLYRISFMAYTGNLTKNNISYISRNNILVYYPFAAFSSEICKIINNDYIYTSLLSTIARQMIEQMCVTRELESEKISDGRIIEAMMESHNMHIGGEHLNTDWLNFNNEGILKVFKTGRKYGKLAKKYNYSFLYNFYSGDIHHISTINKIFPQSIHSSNSYNEKYLETLLSLVKDALLFVNGYCNKLSENDLKIINDFDFVETKC